MSQRELAEEMGNRYDQTVISRVETGQSGLQGDGLCQVARILDVSVDYLLGLTEDPRPPDVLAQTSGIVVIDKANFIEVPKVAATVGAIMYEYDETVVGKLLVSWKWLEQNGVDPERCHLAGVGGKLMEPTLPEGSTILIDLSRKEFQSNGIYVMELVWKYRGESHQALVARRVIWNEKSEDWSYFCDSGGFPPSLFEAQPKVIGEVMWAGEPF